MKANIAVLAGDGIGPEVIDQAVKVSDAVASKFGHEITWKPALTGAAAIDAVVAPTIIDLESVAFINSFSVKFDSLVLLFVPLMQ